MKFIFLLLALVALSNGYEFQEVLSAKERSISSQVVDAIEKAKLQMPCGFPKLGIPPLAPLKLEHKEIKTTGSSLDLQSSFDKLRVYGLNEFDIVEFKLSILFSKISFKFNWKNVHLKSIYDILLNIHDKNLTTKFLRHGNATAAVKDFTVWGTCKYSLGLLGNGGIRLKELKIYAKIGEAQSEVENLSNIGIVNRKLNEIIQTFVMLAINDNTENMASLTNERLLPIINKKLGGKTLDDLLALIGLGGGGGGGSGAGGENGQTTEKQPCVPPPDED